MRGSGGTGLAVNLETAALPMTHGRLASRASMAEIHRRRRWRNFLTFMDEFGCWAFQEAKTLASSLCAKAVCGIEKLCKLVTLAAMFALLLVLTQPGSAVASAPRTQDAQQAVLDFHRAIEGEAFQVAYAQLSPQWRDDISLAEFRRGFQGLQTVNYAVARAELVCPNRARVAVSIRLWRQQELEDYLGHYELLFNGERWLLDNNQLSPASPAS